MSSEPSDRAPTTLAHKKRVKRKDKAPYANNKMDEKYDNQLPEQQAVNKDSDSTSKKGVSVVTSDTPSPNDSGGSRKNGSNEKKRASSTPHGNQDGNDDQTGSEHSARRQKEDATLETVKKDKEQDSEDSFRRAPSIIYTERVQGASMAWKDINMFVKAGKCCSKTKKQLLTNVSGHISKGEIMALMGPSGSGKTTILDVLADRVKKAEITGEILINGKPRDQKKFRYICSYVSVDDEFYEVFTVKETLNFTAALALPKVSGDKRKEKVEKLMQESGMTSCAGTKIGGKVFRGLSTGQRRRLSIAMELLKSPLILFMDEPLSGLDGSAAVNIMECVEGLAQAGMTILLSVHQPPSAVWKIFSSVTLLTAGVVMYSGPTGPVLGFMEKASGRRCPKMTNPPDFFLNLINADFDGHADIKKIARDYLHSAERQDIQEKIELARTMGRGVDDRLVRKRCNYCKQIGLLTKRSLRNGILHPGLYWFRLLVYILLNIIVGTMFLRTNKDITDDITMKMLYFVLCYVVILSISALPFLIVMRPVFLKERSNGLIDTGPYVIATFIGMIPGVLVISLVTSLMIVYMTDVNGFGIFFVTTFLVLMNAESFMYMVSTFTDEHVTATAMAAAFFGTFMICCGFLLQRSLIPDYWIWMYYLAFHTYALRAYIYTHLDGVDGNKTEEAIAKHLLQEIDMDDVDIGTELGVLTGYMFIVFLIFTLVMQFKHTGKK